MARREFQLIEGKASKFWAIELNGTTFTVHYGRIGTSGQAQEKTFASDALAKKEYDKLIAEKEKKGYTETGATVATGAVGVTPTPKVATPKVDKPKEAQEKASPVNSAAASPTSATDDSVQAVPVPSTSPVPVIAAATEIERSARVQADFLARITWREEFRKMRVYPKVEGLSESVLKTKTLIEDKNYYSLYHVNVPPVMSQEEALFWIQTLGKIHHLSSYNHKAFTFSENPEFKSLIKGLPKESYEAIFEKPHVLLPFLTPLELTHQLLSWIDKCEAKQASIYQYGPSYCSGRIAVAFGKYIVPYMSLEDRDTIRTELEVRFDKLQDLSSSHAAEIVGLLAGLGSTRVATWSALQGSKTWGPNYDATGNMFVLAGVMDEATFAKEAKRLIANCRDLEEYELYLAGTEWRHLDFFAGAAIECPNKNDAANIVKVLARVQAPEAALPMLQILLKSKAPMVAAEWLGQNPLLATIGLTPAAMGKGELADAARVQLLSFRRRGHDDIMRAAVAHLAPEQAAWLQDQIINSVQEETLETIPPEEIPEQLRNLLAASTAPGKAASWLDLATLPPIKIGTKKLGIPQIERLLAALKFTELGASSPLFDSLKEHAQRNSLDSFAWAIFSAWMALGAPSKDRWALSVIGHIGGDGCVLKLTPMVREWPGESQHKRAVYGLECLKAVGTDTALMSLNGIAQKLKFKALKEQAQALMNDIATKRGLTREQLADRIVPDCDLDERGTRIFDFGPRQFKFVLGQEMKPMVRDGDGKIRPDLPAPNKSDDSSKAEAAVTEWKILKKTLREVLKVQAERLEDAMITGRRWTTEEFTLLLLKHPLMVNLVRQIVFGAYDKETGTLISTFRGTEDLTLADENDDETELPQNALIGVVHPAHLEADTLSAWGQVMSDYEIIPPFQQLSRTICTPEEQDLEKGGITRFRGARIEGIIVYGMLERSHWLRDTPADGGGFRQHSKYFPSANCTAFIQYEPGLSIGYYDETQRIQEVYFVPGHVKPDWWGDHKNRLKIEDVDKVVISEVLRLANAIYSKAK